MARGGSSHPYTLARATGHLPTTPTDEAATIAPSGLAVQTQPGGGLELVPSVIGQPRQLQLPPLSSPQTSASPHHNHTGPPTRRQPTTSVPAERAEMRSPPVAGEHTAMTNQHRATVAADHIHRRDINGRWPAPLTDYDTSRNRTTDLGETQVAAAATACTHHDH